VLLRFEHVLVFEKRALHVFVEGLGDRFVVELVVAAIGPEIQRLPVGHRGDEVERARLDAHAAVSLRRAASGRRAADVDDHVAGGDPVDDLPAIDVLLEPADALEQGRGGAVDHPARDVDALADHLGGGGKLRHVRRADGAAVEIREVRQIHQVIEIDEVVAADGERVAGRHPAGRIVPVQVRDQRLVGLLRVARPHPQEAPLVRHGVALHRRARGNGVLAGDPHAFAAAVVLQAVVAALQAIADELALGERRAPVHAAVVQGDGLARLRAEENHRLVADPALEEAAPDLVAPRAGVPDVADEHAKAVSSLAV
jgi:hypothetical protein